MFIYLIDFILFLPLLLFFLKNLPFMQYEENQIIKFSIIFSDKFRKIVLVLTRCTIFGSAKDSKMTGVMNLSKKLGFKISFADCNQSTNNIEARETGIMLRWIINNYDDLSKGIYTKVLFHHSHENSEHQKNLSGNLEELFKTKYFWYNNYGDIYPYYLDHPISFLNGTYHVFFRKIDLFVILSDITKGTSFNYFNKTNKYNRWRSGQSSSFFVNNELIIKHSILDYTKLLENVRELVFRLETQHYPIAGVNANYYVGEVTERGWQVLFSNFSYPYYKSPIPVSWTKRTKIYKW